MSGSSDDQVIERDTSAQLRENNQYRIIVVQHSFNFANVGSAIVEAYQSASVKLMSRTDGLDDVFSLLPIVGSRD